MFLQLLKGPTWPREGAHTLPQGLGTLLSIAHQHVSILHDGGQPGIPVPHHVLQEARMSLSLSSWLWEGSAAPIALGASSLWGGKALHK